MKHRILAWDDDKKFGGRTLIAGKYLHQHPEKLKVGVMLYRIGHGTKYRVDEMLPDDSEDAKPGTFKMSVTQIKHDGSEGKKGVAFSVAHSWAIKTADISEEHQRLLPKGEEVEGTIKGGMFIPHKRYLVDWHAQYMNYFRFIRNRTQYDHSNPAKSELPTLLLSVIDEIGPSAFNSFIRYFFAGKRCSGENMAMAHKAMRQYAPIGTSDESKGFAERILYTAIHMGEDFWEATQAIVYKKGVTMDFTSPVR